MVDPSNTSDINMNYEDQKQINRFSSLLSRKVELKCELEKFKENLQTHCDALDEIALCMDPEGILIRFGESYYHVPEEEATERIEELKSQVESKIEEISGELSGIQQEMDKLKVDLYLKFGSNINLDE
ncbi:prefoldin subunit 4 [Cryptosporidium ubiquitum]|uniref:Prefoldin subunit 4 n=1 Tax=Cryptosporidium ubiquitum TaxID=857276 RepID=A0A1J4MI71_9CRYT|nr:prefoldin subunit 4 [Cryptosporidium ubiquitum]OII73926.1 prefoldin subunit 4 [Cryptosporidium ubiquitum]